MSDISIITTAMIVLSLAKSIPVTWASRYLLKKKRNKMSHLTTVKFRISLWKATYYISAVLFASYALRNSRWLFYPEEYAMICHTLPFLHKTYYLVSLSYYFNEFITIFIEPRKKDFYQMLIHHIATITLIILSYSKGLTRYGLAILILHDLADPWLEIAKVNLTLKNTKMANVCFFVFMAVFVVLRIGIYPYFIVLPATRYLLRFKWQFWNMAIAAMLNTLVVTHIIWTYYIFMVLIKILRQDKAVDTRSEEK